MTETFCARIKAARRRAGITRKQMAARIGAPVSRVARIERGQCVRALVDIAAILTALESVGDIPRKDTA